MIERPHHPLHPKIRLVWLVASLSTAILFAVAAFTVSMALAIPLVFPAVAGVVALGTAAAAPALAYKHWRYEIRERDVFISKGFVFSTVALMPFDRIQFVETKQGPLDRWFGLTQLVIKTAGGQVSIPGLAEDEAMRLRERLSEVVGTLSV